MGLKLFQGMQGFKELKRSNLLIRCIFGLMMLKAFIYLCKKDVKYILLFTLCLTMGISFEIISVVKIKGRSLPLNKALIGYLAIVIYASKVLPTLLQRFPHLTEYSIVQKYQSFAFCLYALGLIGVVLSLKRRTLSYQLTIVCTVHISCYILGMACCYAGKNLERGRFYYFYPSILIISNDSWAYFIGKAFGRRKLYELSPKKTVEGFFGGAIFTFVTSFFLIYLKLSHGFLPDSMDDFFKMHISSSIRFLNFPVGYLHAVAFGFFASFVAPFVGFLTSAIKRTFRRKDFGSLIPGHGGLTDRMDCQVFMVFFTHYYLNLFLVTREESLVSLSRYVLKNYTKEEVKLFTDRLVSSI